VAGDQIVLGGTIVTATVASGLIARRVRRNLPLIHPLFDSLISIRGAFSQRQINVKLACLKAMLAFLKAYDK
jgi:molybdenum cofactor biosynthesis enzyme